MHQRAGPIFSNIRKVVPAQVQDQRSVDQNNEVECVPSWFWLAFALVCGFTIAMLVLICFFSLFYYFKITGAENVAKGKDCPGTSCFCTDCNHRNIYSNEKTKTRTSLVSYGRRGLHSTDAGLASYCTWPRFSWLLPCHESLCAGCLGWCRL